MKKYLSLFIVAAIMAVSVFSFSRTASADEMKMVGVMTKCEIAADGKTATATLKDNKTGENVDVMVSDELTLDKFKDKRIVEGDEIRCKFDKQGDKNVSKIFKKTAGC